MTWRYLLYAQFPAFFLLALLFFTNYMLARKGPAVKSVLWVLLFGVALTCSVLFLVLGIHEGDWALKTVFPLGLASWIGIILVLAGYVAHVVHLIEKKHNRKIMEKELQKAAKEKDDALAQAREESAEAARIAREEGRLAAQQEAAEARFSQTAETVGLEAAGSELASAAHTPIELTLDAPVEPAADSFPPITEPTASDELPPENF
ncbi:MAG: hypothetical protein E7425_07010 [Ruminococcaceae bacterium]|jgi:uncharacterized membrane protein|nr:hypothetical protein [Oscillospiraceae bacterium]